MVNKIAILEFWSGDFGEKMSVWGGLGALHFFFSLKKRTRTFNYRYSESSCNILGPLGQYDHRWEKEKKKTNK